MIEIRKLQLGDEVAYRRFEEAMLAEKTTNSFVEMEYIDDLPKAILEGQESEIKKEGQIWSTYSTYYAFVNGEIAGMIRCFWEADNETVVNLGQLGYMSSPVFRRQGIVQHLIQFAMELFAEKGYDRISVVAAENNLPSRRLIEKMSGQLEKISQIDYFGKSMMAAKYQFLLK
ncbi:GNAT family N-acetyltransferase [Streptococcus ovis]|uniref:GNAT family N-acetyltransferase n=1 Tax=Streptococcus ovis TaxID=82806 RepID=UPI00037C27C1|nr:GNAT family N-acetyltransferase [Streptococcus ovis]